MTALDQALVHFDKAFRLLVVEDDPTWVEIIGEWLRSPLWNLTVADSWEGLHALPLMSRAHWSCVIADIELGGPSGKSGIDVLRSFSHFPVKITLSGLKSMEAAFQATRVGGARAVFDKSNPETQVRFPAAVARFAALGFMLDSNCPDHVDTLFALVEDSPESVTEWLDKACIVRRRLEQICDAFLVCTPKEAIQHHRALTHIQLQSARLAGNGANPLPDLKVTEDQILAAMKRYRRISSVLQ